MKFLLSVLICFFFLPSVMAVSPVAYWDMNEGVGTTAEDSIAGNNGTLVGGSAWATGRFGYGVDLNGVDGGVNVSYDPSLDIIDNNDSFAVAVWIQMDKLVSDAAVDNVILSQQDGAGTGRTWLQIDTDNTIRSSHGGNPVLISNLLVDLIDKWYFIVLNYNGTHLDLYVDGTYDVTKITGTDASANGDYNFGRSKSGTKWFNGTIDDAKFFDRNLSVVEIKELYNPSVSGRVLSLRFRELGLSPQRIVVFYPNGTKQGDYNTSGVVKINSSLGNHTLIVHPSKMSMLGDPNQGFNLLEYHAGTLPSAAAVLGGVVVSFSLVRRLFKK